ncbi:uncharacterized protein BYT42DRAFT_536616 [Radiomyces spectabilis]|uniref:uncharacterized protein n=1 Tax=Radiomyces spectabilis TaxID=64574 RepID=UPI002220B0A1|nr:uncharacterized protein BYT42DRAFT_536616 [Radiomyces spectabilis]KAI8373243.1 hypothetical protein BYT42DRAFT_536616 [Radiomyces spectabilis]
MTTLSNSSPLPPPSPAFTVTDYDGTIASLKNSSNFSDFVANEKDGLVYLSPRDVHQNLVELKIGVLLPFHQADNNSTKEYTLSGVAAVRMAAAEINAQRLIPGAYITLIEKDSFPDKVPDQTAITQAVFSTVALIQEGVIGVIGDISSSWTSLSALMTSTLQIPQCSFTASATSLSDKSQYGYFFRTVPTRLLYVDAAVSFIVNQKWPIIGILYTKNNAGHQLSDTMVIKAKLNGIRVRAYQHFIDHGPNSNLEQSIDALMKNGVRIIFLAAEGEARLAALTVAAHMGHVNNETVWITTGDLVPDKLFSVVQHFNDAILHRRNGSDIPWHTNTTQPSSSSSSSDGEPKFDLVLHAALQTDRLVPIEYTSAFSGGVFWFEQWMDLAGYAPYDDFMDKWLRLNPSIYPYAGQRNVSGIEGLAYSCMMVMARGFSQLLRNATNATDTLGLLATNQLDPPVTPSMFNTGYVGPDGPILFDQNGDPAVGNFLVYNLQNGSEVEIGHILGGQLNLTSNPVFHDGTTSPPSGAPTSVSLNPGLSSPASLAVASFASIGTLLAIVTIIIIVIYRHHEVFKASNVLFCVLEVIGLILCYMSIFFYTSYRTSFTCSMLPICFHIGYSLALSNMIAKNYTIYRVSNNVYVNQIVITNMQLLKVVGSVVGTHMLLVIAWFAFVRVSAVEKPVSMTTYYIVCSYNGPAHASFLWLLSLFAASQLIVATWLAVKTKSLAPTYTHYNETKQINMTIYNIFFSALIGFTIYCVPTADSYTRAFLTEITIVWATTFSLLMLFLPKFRAIFFRRKSRRRTPYHRPPQPNQSRRPSRFETQDLETRQTLGGELISLNGMLSKPGALLSGSHFSPVGSLQSPSPDADNIVQSQGIVLEAHKAQIPIQVSFKWFPFLSAWDMKNVILFPRVGYFSFFSEATNKGKVFSYTHATNVSSSSTEGHVLKVHGTGFYDVYIQLATRDDAECWHTWFNSKDPGFDPENTLLTSRSCLTTRSTMVASTDKKSDSTQKLKKEDSSDRYLLERQESGITIETVESAVSTLHRLPSPLQIADQHPYYMHVPSPSTLTPGSDIGTSPSTDRPTADGDTPSSSSFLVPPSPLRSPLTPAFDTSRRMSSPLHHPPRSNSQHSLFAAHHVSRRPSHQQLLQTPSPPFNSSSRRPSDTGSCYKSFTAYVSITPSSADRRLERRHS